MNVELLHTFLPELDDKALDQVVNDPSLRSALDDLKLVLAELERGGLDAKVRRDWEVTRDELVAEARRLSHRISNPQGRPI